MSFLWSLTSRVYSYPPQRNERVSPYKTTLDWGKNLEVDTPTHMERLVVLLVEVVDQAWSLVV